MIADWQALRQRLRPAQSPVDEGPSYFDLAQAAHRELVAAQSQFEEVRDRDLVDHAIFRLRAAERHYVFLLRQVREQNTSSRGGSSIGSTRG